MHHYWTLVAVVGTASSFRIHMCVRLAADSHLCVSIFSASLSHITLLSLTINSDTLLSIFDSAGPSFFPWSLYLRLTCSPWTFRELPPQCTLSCIWTSQTSHHWNLSVCVCVHVLCLRDILFPSVLMKLSSAEWVLVCLVWGFGCWRNALKQLLHGENAVRVEEVSGMETTVLFLGLGFCLCPCVCLTHLTFCLATRHCHNSEMCFSVLCR